MIARGVERAMSGELASPEWYDAMHATTDEAVSQRQLDEAQRNLDRMAAQMAGSM